LGGLLKKADHPDPRRPFKPVNREVSAACFGGRPGMEAANGKETQKKDRCNRFYMRVCISHDIILHDSGDWWKGISQGIGVYFFYLVNAVKISRILKILTTEYLD
jgi:hypothetical protein